MTTKQSGVNIALQPVGSLTPGYRKDVYCADELLNDARYPKSAMQANCDNFEQPDTYVSPANLRLVAPSGFSPSWTSTWASSWTSSRSRRRPTSSR